MARHHHKVLLTGDVQETQSYNEGYETGPKNHNMGSGSNRSNSCCTEKVSDLTVKLTAMDVAC